jgi:hypothetical protein
MNRERVATAALRALPRQLRATHGEEIIDTLLDSSATASRRRFARELADLVRAGLRARATQTATVGTRRLLADGFCRGAILVMTLDLSTLLSQRLRGLEDPLLSWPSIGALGVMLTLALIGAERLAGVAALVWTAARFPELLEHNATFTGIAPTIVPLVCFSVLVLSPRPREIDPRRISWLAATGALVAAYGPPDGNGLITAIVTSTALLLMFSAVVSIPADPRLTIACALPASYVGLMVAGAPALPAWLLFLGAPLALSVAIIRTWRLRQYVIR